MIFLPFSIQELYRQLEDMRRQQDDWNKQLQQLQKRFDELERKLFYIKQRNGHWKDDLQKIVRCMIERDFPKPEVWKDAQTHLKHNKASLKSLKLWILFNNIHRGEGASVAFAAERLRAVQEDLNVVQQSALSMADPGRCHEDKSPLLNHGPLKMHARSRLCIFNEVCLKYLIALCSFGKQIHLFLLIFDAEMNKCKTHIN